MAETDPADLLAPVLAVAARAAKEILRYYRQPLSVEHKSDHTPLTQADLAAHEVITTGLESLTPDVPVLSEESAKVPFSQRRRWDQYWLVDPLDGTREFLRSNDQFAVNIALIQNHEPVLGVIHVPVSNAVYFAASDHGAHRQQAPQDPAPIRVHAPHRQPPVVAVSRFRRSRRLERFLQALGPHETYTMGSSLKACLVAEGTVDLYPSLGPTSEWDTAAAQCVVEQAGGQLTDTALQPLRYNTKDSLENPDFLAFGDTTVDWTRFLE